MDTFKVILVGEAGVGKTQLLRTFAGETFSEALNPTRGMECTPVKIFLEGREVTLQIWDTATWWSQDRFRNVTTKQYKEAHAVVYVYDSNDAQTVYGVRAAFDDVRSVNTNCVKMLVGTKYDLKPKNLINKPMNQGQMLANTLSLPYFEVSAKVSPPAPETAFFSLAKILLATTFPNHMIVKGPSLAIQALTISDEKAIHDTSLASPSSYRGPLSSPSTRSPSTPSPLGTAAYASLAVAAFQGGANPHSTYHSAHPSSPAHNTFKPTPQSSNSAPLSSSPSVFNPASSTPSTNFSYVIRSRYVAPNPFGLPVAEFENEYNVVLLGDARVGKTQLLHSFLDEDFSEAYNASRATYSSSKILDVEGRKVKLQLWDTSENDATSTVTALRNAHGVLILYDMTESNSFENCRKYFEQTQGVCTPKVRILLAGNKTDLAEKVVETSDAQKLASSLKIPMFEISARASFNVETMFRALTKAIRAVPTIR